MKSITGKETGNDLKLWVWRPREIVDGYRLVKAAASGSGICFPHGFRANTMDFLTLL